MSQAGNEVNALSAVLNLPGYEFREEIGRGGMGVVYRARDLGFERDVAIKVLGEKATADSFAAARFRNEARITGQLQHPGIPAAHELGTLSDGKPFLAMKLVKGATLQAMLDLRSSPNEDRGKFIAIFEQICHAVGFAHAHSVIHRDLKPSNVMVGKFGEVQIMDWGLAKILGDSREEEVAEADTRSTAAFVSGAIETPAGGDSATRTGSVLGTPAYMPPEQASGQIRLLDARSDVFGLGAILCEMLTGKPPYQAKNANDVRIMAVRGELQEATSRLDACGAEPDLISVAKRCLAFKKEERPADGQVVADDVRRIRAESEARARAAELEKNAALVRVAESVKRRRQFFTAASLIGLVMILGMIGTGYGLFRAQESAIAERKAKEEAQGKQKEAEEERKRAEDREQEAIDAVKRFGDAVAKNPELKNNAALIALRRELLKEPVGYFKALRERLQADKTTRPESLKRVALAAFELGFLTNAIGDKQDAIAAYQEAIEIDARLARENPAVVEFASGLARSHINLGVLLSETGKLIEAQAVYEEAKRTLERLARENPTVPLFAFDLANCDTSLGTLLRSSGKSAEARAAFQNAIEIGARLVRENPSVAEYVAALARSHNNLGVVLNDSGKSIEALAAHGEAKKIQERLVRENPATPLFARDLAHSLNSLGLLLVITGKPVEALAAHEEAIKIRERLSRENPTVTEYASDLARSHHDLALVLRATGKPTEALAAFEEAKKIWERLARENPTVTEFVSGLARTHNHLAAVLSETGKPAESLAAHEEALKIRERLARENPTEIGFAKDLAGSHHDLGIELSSAGKLAEARAAYEEAIKIQERLVRENPTMTVLVTELGNSHNSLGLVLTYLGEPAESLAAFEKARTIRERLVRDHPAVIQFQSELGGTLSNVGMMRLDAGELLEAKELALAAIEYQKQALAANPREPVYRQFLRNHYLLLQATANRLRDGDLEDLAKKGIAELSANDPQFADVDRRLASIANGEAPKDTAELLLVAQRAYDTQKFALAARCFGDAIEREPQIAEDRQKQLAYNAACSAVRAASGEDVAKPDLDEAGKASLRAKALGWLNIELTAWEKFLEKPEAKPLIAQTMAHWQEDLDLASVRDLQKRAALPEAERKEWGALWARVKEVLEKSLGEAKMP